MKSLSIVLCLLAACDLALAKEMPLPRAKPLAVAHPSSPVPEVLPLHGVEAWPSDCALRLAVIARFSHQPSLNGPSQYGTSDVVRLEGSIMPNSGVVSVMPAATLRYPLAEAVAHWVRNDLGPALAEFDSSPAAVTTQNPCSSSPPSYCRSSIAGLTYICTGRVPPRSDESSRPISVRCISKSGRGATPERTGGFRPRIDQPQPRAISSGFYRFLAITDFKSDHLNGSGSSASEECPLTCIGIGSGPIHLGPIDFFRITKKRDEAIAMSAMMNVP
jgi:hypothetical protein